MVEFIIKCHINNRKKCLFWGKGVVCGKFEGDGIFLWTPFDVEYCYALGSGVKTPVIFLLLTCVINRYRTEWPLLRAMRLWIHLSPWKHNIKIWNNSNELQILFPFYSLKKEKLMYPFSLKNFPFTKSKRSVPNGLAWEATASRWFFSSL